MSAHVVRRRGPDGRWNSKPKFAFKTFMDAHIVARRYYLEDGMPRDGYKCTKCEAFHVGRRPSPYSNKAMRRHSLPDGNRGLYVGRQRLYRLIRRHQQQISGCGEVVSRELAKF